MKKIIYTILALPLLINISFAETDEEKGLKIAKQTYENSRGFVDSQSDQVMILIDPNGNEVVCEIAGNSL